jgi:hypothetical protein
MGMKGSRGDFGDIGFSGLPGRNGSVGLRGEKGFKGEPGELPRRSEIEASKSILNNYFLCYFTTDGKSKLNVLFSEITKPWIARY